MPRKRLWVKRAKKVMNPVPVILSPITKLENMQEDL
jgi:hypothetical protein